MAVPIRESRRCILLALAAILVAGRYAPVAVADDTEKPLAIAIENKRAEVKELEGKALELRESLQRWTKDMVIDQEIRTRTSDASYQNAKLTTQVTEIAVQEYLRGTYVGDRQKRDADLKLANYEVEHFTKMVETNDDPETRLQLEQAKLHKESAEISLDILERFTKPARLRELRSAVERSKLDEGYARAALSLEQTKERRLRDKAAQFKTGAPGPQVLALLDESIALQVKLATVVANAKALEEKAKQDPVAVEKAIEELKEKRAEAASLSAQAQRRLEDAIFLAKEISSKQAHLRHAEESLQKARAELDALERKARSN